MAGEVSPTYGDATSTLTASQKHTALLNDFSFGGGTWSAVMSEQTVSGGKVSAMLLKDGLIKATSIANVIRLLGVFEAEQNSPVVIDDSSRGLEVSLKVTDTGYLLMLNDDRDAISKFGVGLFKPFFTVFWI